MRCTTTVLALACAATLLAGCTSEKPVDTTTLPLTIKTLSNRADLVSDGNVLVELVLPTGASISGLKVDLAGRDVTRLFTTGADGRTLGVLDGLALGSNLITASTSSTAVAVLTVTNHDRGGPVLSGTQATPFFCATPTPQGATGTTPATNASGLSAAATTAQCQITTETKLYYKSTATGCSLALPDPSPSVAYTATAPATTATPPANPCFKPYDPAAAAPGDLATTTTDKGLTLPYIVRVERGTMNRGIYDIAVLYDPSKPAWTATAPQPQWNGKLLYTFGASTGQPRRQVRPATAWTDDKSLKLGYMVAVNSMTDSSANSHRVAMAETVMMMKEHITDTYGPIKFTMGAGCSGGSINSHMNASIQPGLLDGVTVSCAYPDSETTTMEVSDCTLLVEAYQKPAWTTLMAGAGYTQAEINAKKAAVNGHIDPSACHGWTNFFGSNAKAGQYFQRTVPAANNDTGVIVQSATATNNCQLPGALVYDPLNNPAGARCNAWSWAEGVWGRATGSAGARETRDNVGVQYGLKALLDDRLTGEEFVTLNEQVGGTDRDTNFTTTRSTADAEALAIAYRSGIVMSGAQLAKTPVIDMRGYDDSLINLPPGLTSFTPAQLQGTALFGIHQQWRSHSIRDRLDRDAGGHGSQVMWRFGRNGFSPSAAMALEAFTTMDAWLASLVADTATTTTRAQKVLSTKPAAATDWCHLSSDAAQTTKVSDAATCNADFYLQPRSSPRQVAGSPRTEDILKCQLRPINLVEYGSRLSAAQLTRLQAVFPDGVCDWSKPGVGQQAALGPLSFKAGPGGVALGDAPVSRAR